MLRSCLGITVSLERLPQRQTNAQHVDQIWGKVEVGGLSETVCMSLYLHVWHVTWGSLRFGVRGEYPCHENS